MDTQVLEFRKFEDYGRQLAARVHDWERDEFRLAFARARPSALATSLAEIDQVDTGGGYIAGPGGGIALAGRKLERDGVIARVTFEPTEFRAFGGSVGPIASIVLYNKDSSYPINALVACYDLEEPVTILDGASIRVLPEPSGVLWWLK